MKSCDVDKLTLLELYDAITHKKGAKHSVIVPIFQRGKSWSEKLEKEFIDSVRMGLPFGSMLVYRRILVENNETVYNETLIDGLQRSNAIKKYIEHPLRFTTVDTLPDDIVVSILNEIGIVVSDEKKNIIREIIKTVFSEMDKDCKKLSEIEPSKVAAELLDVLIETGDYSGKLLMRVADIVKPYFAVLQQEYNDITSVVVPFVVYSGDEENLPLIFKKINSSGVELSELEIYSATWPNTKLPAIDNENIVNAVLKKYDQLVDTGFTLDGYDPNLLRTSKQLTAFEYVFGLSKYINATYDFLSYFESKEQPDTINSLAFELVNACLNQNKKGKDKLYENILSFSDINLFENRLIEAIRFVESKIRLITAFKGNSRTDKNTKFHGKFQIMSLVANTFREMYDQNDLSKYRDSWGENKKILEKNIVLYYVYDVINNTWNDGGTSKIYTYTYPNRYMQHISCAQWNNCLDTFFEDTNMDANKINPDKKDKLILNCIYLDIISYKDNADSEIKFDIEHLATKELMKKIKETAKCSSLVVGSIGNLCYLKEGTNREKHEKTIYQYGPIAEQLSEIEEKYSFTKKEDLEWIEKVYKPNDAAELKKVYYAYTKAHFGELKKRFFSSMGIVEENDASDRTNGGITENNRIVPQLPKDIKKVGQFIRTAMKNLSDVGFVFTDEELDNLCSLEWGKQNLKTGQKIPFAKLHVEGEVNEHKVGKDNVYIKTLFSYGSRSILIKTDLYDYSREPFIKWYQSLAEHK